MSRSGCIRRRRRTGRKRPAAVVDPSGPVGPVTSTNAAQEWLGRANVERDIDVPARRRMGPPIRRARRIARSALRASSARASISAHFGRVAEWQTRRIQNPLPREGCVGSSPTSASTNRSPRSSRRRVGSADGGPKMPPPRTRRRYGPQASRARERAWATGAPRRCADQDGRAAIPLRCSHAHTPNGGAHGRRRRSGPGADAHRGIAEPIAKKRDRPAFAAVAAPRAAEIARRTEGRRVEHERCAIALAIGARATCRAARAYTKRETTRHAGGPAAAAVRRDPAT